MRLLNVCGGNISFFGKSSMAWSRLLVEGTARNKKLWWKLTKHQVSFGLQYEVADDFELTSILLQEQPSCGLVTSRTVERVVEEETTAAAASYLDHPTPPLATIEQVLRRPWANQGRLETWITTTTTTKQEENDCQLQYRQVLPFYMTPSWQSLQVITSDDDNDDNESTTTKPSASVEWNDQDLSSVLTVTADYVPRSLVLSLDYQPAFLSLDDFPGDPNRGRELPPAVVTVVCPSKIESTNTYTSYTVYSNPLLILPPVPDMSMPFNVLSLTCSMYAYIVGSIITLAIKKSSQRIQYKLHPEKKPKSKVQKLKEKMQGKWKRLREKTETNETNEDDKSSGDLKFKEVIEETKEDESADDTKDAATLKENESSSSSIVDVVDKNGDTGAIEHEMLR
jgi:hypothetical protein